MFGETTIPHPEMTIRFEGLTAAQVAAVHEAVQNAKTDTHAAAGRGGKDQGGTRFIRVTKSEMKGEDGKYAVLLTITTLMIGFVFPPPNGSDSLFATVQPSRDALHAIFDAAGVLPLKEVITRHKSN